MKKGRTKKRIQIELSHEQCDYVAERAAEYGSASEYMRDLIQREQNGKAASHVERQLLAGLESGPMRPFGPDYFQELRAQVRAVANGERRSPARKAGPRARRK